MSPSVPELLVEYDRALAYTDELWLDLKADEVRWRPHEQSSAIGWHLGHQAAVAHFMVRNLTAAEPSPDAELEPLMDSATPEQGRGELPDLGRLADFGPRSPNGCTPGSATSPPATWARRCRCRSSARRCSWR